MAKITKEQIAEFKETEKEAEDATEFTWLAEEVAEAGEKVWAKKLYNKAEELAEDLESYQSLADSVANDDYLGDKAWARAFYKKAEELAENSDEYKDLSFGVKLDYKKWAFVFGNLNHNNPVLGNPSSIEIRKIF